MATVSSLSAPGVEVREYDNSLRIVSNTGTTVFVPGYAAQGPVEEVISISSINDFETIYGIPTNDAERYFYYTCLAILNNSGAGTTLLTSRLPYGSGEGDNIANSYTMLAYPAIPVVKASDNSKSYNYHKPDATGLAEFFNLVAISKTNNNAKPIKATVEHCEVVINSDKEVDGSIFTLHNVSKGLIPSLAATGKSLSNIENVTIEWSYGKDAAATNISPVSIYAETDKTDETSIIVHVYGQLVTTADEVYGYFTADIKYKNSSEVFDITEATISKEFTSSNKPISFAFVPAYKTAENFDVEEGKDVTYVIGAPATFNVSLSEYYQIISGEYFQWSKEGKIENFGKELKNTLENAAIVAINVSRTTINDSYEGYYFGITDNIFNEPSDDYSLKAIDSIKFTNWTRKANEVAGIIDSKDEKENKFIEISKNRLDFQTASSIKGSISSILQNSINSFDTSTEDYDDTVNFAIFKLAKSAVGTEAMKLTYSIVEKYNAALGKGRLYSTANNVSPQNYFIENIVDGSRNISIMVNPYIANRIKLLEDGSLQGKVRFLSNKLINIYKDMEKKYISSQIPASIASSDDISKAIKLSNININNWKNLSKRAGVSIDMLNKFAGEDEAYACFSPSNSLYPFATYSVPKKNNKVIGNTPAKITRILDVISNDEEYPDIDIVVEGGLSTIYAYSNNAKAAIQEDNNSIISNEGDGALDEEQGGNNHTFNSALILQGIEDLRTSRTSLTEEAENVMNDYTAIQEAFQSIANSFQNGGRGDTFYVADILRGTLLRGANTKVERLYGTKLTNNIYSGDEKVNHSWSTSIYNPIKHLVENFTTSYASVYAQWVKINDTHTNEKVWVPVSGYMTALMCASDQLQGPWYAAAGLNRGIVEGVLDCAVNPNQKQRGDLYKICVNSVPKLANIGITNWGIRTLSKKASAFDQNTCRRTFLFIEKAIKKLLRYYLFEPNNAYTQLAIYNEIEPYMESIRNQGGVYSYTVVVDSSNNTPEIVNAGNLAVDVSAAPTRTAEFIVLNMTANKYTQEVATSEMNG